MGLYRRKDSPVWWMSFSVNNRQYQRSTCTDDRKIALRIYDSVRGKVALGTWIPEAQEKRQYTFSELAERYSSYKKSRVKSLKSVTNESSVYSLLKASLGEFVLNDITVQKLEQMQSDWIGKGNEPATVNRKFDVLRNMFVKALDWEMVNEDTLKRVKRVKRLKTNNKRLRFLSAEEARKLVNVAEPHLKPILITALNTGCRKGELLGLRWDAHIDLKHGFILLDKTKGSERREIPVNDVLKETLQGLARRLDVPYVFYDAETGKPYGDVKRSFKTAVRRAGIKDFKFHDLRHTFASHLVMSGVDITTVSKLLGHKTLTMTLRYAHLALSHLSQAVKKLNNIFNPQTPCDTSKKQAVITIL